MAAGPIHQHRAPDPGIEFHCEHPSSPSMPGVDIEKAYQDRYTLPPLFIEGHGRWKGEVGGVVKIDMAFPILACRGDSHRPRSHRSRSDARTPRVVAPRCARRQTPGET